MILFHKYRMPIRIVTASFLFFVGSEAVSNPVSGMDPESATESSWTQLGPPIKASQSLFVDVDASRHALSPSLAYGNLAPYLGWIELNSHGVAQVYVRHWNGARWTRNDGTQNMDVTHPVLELALASNGEIPYLAWVEANRHAVPQLYLKHRIGDQWILDGESLNRNPAHRAANPAIVVSGPIPYLAWSEINDHDVFQLYVKHLTNGRWRSLGQDSINLSPLRDAIAPSLTLKQGSIPYIAWSELSGGQFYQVYVKRWNGSDWELLGRSLNNDPTAHALNPSLAILNDVPYVAWNEIDSGGVSHLHVKHFEKGSWRSDGGKLNLDPNQHALSPVLLPMGPVLYLSWKEYADDRSSKIHVKRWVGKTWEVMDQNLDVVPGTSGSFPSLAGSEKQPYIAWKTITKKGLYHIIVKRLQTE